MTASLLRRGSLREGAGKKGEKEGALLSPIFAQSIIIMANSNKRSLCGGERLTASAGHLL